MTNNPWKDLSNAQDKLLACYRLGKRPSDALLDKITRLREKCKRWDTKTNPDVSWC
jgi:hypothetical protein